MKPSTLEEIFRAKKERRAQLSGLPLQQKIEIIEELQKAGRTMIRARNSLRTKASGKEL